MCLTLFDSLMYLGVGYSSRSESSAALFSFKMRGLVTSVFCDGNEGFPDNRHIPYGDRFFVRRCFTTEGFLRQFHGIFCASSEGFFRR